MSKSRPQLPRPDRRRSIRGSFSWIDHRFLREGFGFLIAQLWTAYSAPSPHNSSGSTQKKNEETLAG